MRRSRILHYFQRRSQCIRADSPVGAGIAGSSALNIAVCAAVARWCGVVLQADAIMQIAMNVEAQAIDVPTGVQDYRPALYGGISAVELRVDGVRRVALPVEPLQLPQRLVLAYTNASRNSGTQLGRHTLHTTATRRCIRASRESGHSGSHANVTRGGRLA